MNIAIFADVHGRILLAFKLCARWQQETGERIDLILQAGDLGVFPQREGLDKATIRHAERDASELGFASDFLTYRAEVAAALAATTCDLVFVRGNHEDHSWLDALERAATGPIFPVDAYHRVYCLVAGVPYTIAWEASALTVLGVGRVGPPIGEHETGKPKYAQTAELERLYALGDTRIDVLLTHDARRDAMTTGFGIEEIGLVLDAKRPAFHCFGHYGGPCLLRTDANGVTCSCKLADLNWERTDRGQRLAPCSMGILRWQDHDSHSFAVVEAPWLREYSAHTWQYL
jgi:hypothetical protein